MVELASLVSGALCSSTFLKQIPRNAYIKKKKITLPPINTPHYFSFKTMGFALVAALLNPLRFSEPSAVTVWKNPATSPKAQTIFIFFLVSAISKNGFTLSSIK